MNEVSKSFDFLNTTKSNAVTKAVPNVNKTEIVEKRKKMIGIKCQTFFEENPFLVSKGLMQYLYDEYGIKYIDCISNVQHVGHCHPKVTQAISEQLSNSTCNVRFISSKLTECAEEILKTFCDTAIDTILFCNSGSEANDLAMRMAKDFTENDDIIILDHAYHGHITSTMQVSPYKFNHGSTIKKPDWVHVAPVPDVYRGIHKLPDNELHNEISLYNTGQKYADEIDMIVKQGKKAGRKFFAFMTEALQSCGGQIIIPKGFMKNVAKIMHENNSLIIVDEIQTGFGRVGNFFWAHQLYKDEYAPDIITMGKSMGNGFPVAAVVTRREIADKLGGDVGYFNTYGGNPVACAAVLEVINVIKEENLLKHVQKMALLFQEKLNILYNNYDFIGDVRGIGMFWGIDLVINRHTRKPATELAKIVIMKLRQDYRILLNADGPYTNILKFKPPLYFNEQDLTQCFEALNNIFKELSQKTQ